MSWRGMLPRQEAVRRIAALLLQQRGRSERPSKNCISKLVTHHNSLKSVCNRKYNYRRAKCEGSIPIREWFKRLRDTVAKYSIVDDDIYNFDEMGFQMTITVSDNN